MNQLKNEIEWVGSSKTYIDQPTITPLHHITVGRYGGHSLAGANKNEDGCLVWAGEKQDWEFAVILDAHYSAQSAELVVSELNAAKSDLVLAMEQPVPHCFKESERLLLSLFNSAEFREKCQQVKGETACLLALRKGKYVWWLSIGDCVLYLFHPELAEFHQYQLNHRNFYEWIGKVNTFEIPIPCYSSGVRELRKGANTLLLATDGIMECKNTNFDDPHVIYKLFAEQGEVEKSIQKVLHTVERNHGRDSATAIAWTVTVEEEGSEPSDLRVPPELRKQ